MGGAPTTEANFLGEMVKRLQSWCFTSSKFPPCEPRDDAAGTGHDSIGPSSPPPPPPPPFPPQWALGIGLKQGGRFEDRAHPFDTAADCYRGGSTISSPRLILDLPSLLCPSSPLSAQPRLSNSVCRLERSTRERERERQLPHGLVGHRTRYDSTWLSLSSPTRERDKGNLGSFSPWFLSFLPSLFFFFFFFFFFVLRSQKAPP